MKITVQQVLIVEIHAAKLQPNKTPMKQLPKPKDDVSVHWTYSPEEWSIFRKSRVPGQGFLAVFGRFLSGVFSQKAPTVQITPEKILIGRRCRHFNNNRTFIRTVDLRDQGGINILSIRFTGDENSRSAGEIIVPVPRGKLKEAIRLQENLLETAIV
jgi:hypothetical protein